LIIYALTKGYLDDIPVEDIIRFEDELNQWAKSNAAELLSEIRETKSLPDGEKFEQAINEFKKSFSKSEELKLSSKRWWDNGFSKGNWWSN